MLSYHRETALHKKNIKKKNKKIINYISLLLYVPHIFFSATLTLPLAHRSIALNLLTETAEYIAIILRLFQVPDDEVFLRVAAHKIAVLISGISYQQFDGHET